MMRRFIVVDAEQQVIVEGIEFSNLSVALSVSESLASVIYHTMESVYAEYITDTNGVYIVFLDDKPEDPL